MPDPAALGRSAATRTINNDHLPGQVNAAPIFRRHSPSTASPREPTGGLLLPTFPYNSYKHSAIVTREVAPKFNGGHPRMGGTPRAPPVLYLAGGVPAVREPKLQGCVNYRLTMIARVQPTLRLGNGKPAQLQQSLRCPRGNRVPGAKVTGSLGIWLN